MKTKASSPTNSPSTDTIRELAYGLWMQAGCPAGRDQEFWLQAEQQIDSRVPEKKAASAKQHAPRKPNLLTVAPSPSGARNVSKK